VCARPEHRVFAALVAALLCGCTLVRPAPTTVECRPPPEAGETLAQAWQAYQPDQPISLAVTLRRRLFAFQTLLLSAGMYDDYPPAEPSRVNAEYAPQFVRDFGMSRNEGLADALNKLSRTLQDARERSEADFDGNCGLILARRALRMDPVTISTDWILQTVTWGFAPYFQTSISQLIQEAAPRLHCRCSRGGSSRVGARVHDASSRALAGYVRWLTDRLARELLRS
jgi:hypothetical protein